jgi:hypothetical protein
VVLSPGYAQTLSLHCKGKNEGTDIQTSFEPIDIQVHVKTGQVFGFPIYKAPGCSDKLGENFSVDFNVTENDFFTKCSSGYATSIINLNRYSGFLSIRTIFHKKNENWSGQFSCNQQNKKF